MYLDNVWRSSLAITGIDEIPQIMTAGNVIRPKTAMRCSMRLSPVTDPDVATKVIIDKLTKDVPYNAQVKILNTHSGPGWCMKEPEKWLSEAI